MQQCSLSINVHRPKLNENHHLIELIILTGVELRRCLFWVVYQVCCTITTSKLPYDSLSYVQQNKSRFLPENWGDTIFFNISYCFSPCSPCIYFDYKNDFPLKTGEKGTHCFIGYISSFQTASIRCYSS